MSKPVALVLFFLLFVQVRAQQLSLPADLRQHTLTQYNASLFNSAFSLERNNPQSVALWTRWQWQNVDADPTTLFLNYSRKLNEKSGASIGFFQHNTGIFFNTGGAINYAYQLEFNRLIKLSFGANVFGFVQELADTRFQVSPIPGIPQSVPTNDFILQVAPGFNLQIENFSMSLASENLFDYNFTDKAGNTANSDKIFMGMASYDFPVMASDSTAYIRPSIYLRTIPELDNQIGLNALFSTNKFWIQSGYNNFYGVSAGAGGTFFNRFSVGALVEFGIGSSLNSNDPSFEILASYYLGKPEKRRPLVASGILNESAQVVTLGEDLTNEEIQKELEKAEKLSNQGVEEKDEPKVEVGDEVVADEEMNQTEEAVEEPETKVDKKEERRLAAEQKAIEKQQRKDSIAEVKREKEALEILKKQEEEEAKKVAEEAAIKAEEAKEAAELAEEVKKQELKKKKDEEEVAEAERIEQQRKLDSIADARKAAAVIAMQKKEQEQQDSISDAKKAEALVEAARVRAQQQSDSIAKAAAEKELAVKKAAEEAERVAKAEEVMEAKPEVVKPQAGEKYQEVANEEGLEPGYYLIANVFGTKKYFDAFMGDLRGQGLQPKSFYRAINKYNYAYLERYNTIREARQARDSNFNGQFSGKTWIFRVVGK